MPVWDDFFEAQVGASAALAGLLFVGISINMPKIVAEPSLPNRALQALTLLVAILLISTVLLVPGQATVYLGIEVVGIGGAVLALALQSSTRSLKEVREPYRRWHVGETAVVLIATALYPIAGLVMIGVGTEGNYLLVPAFLVSFVVAILDSWVLLVEINR